VIQVDTIDANQIQLCLGADLGGLTSAKAPPVVADIDEVETAMDTRRKSSGVR
jgi:hypothetical protein